MGSSWQTPDQKAFFDKHLASYIHDAEDGDLQEFWKSILKEWFEAWPLSEPPAEVVQKEGTLEKAQKAWKGKKISVSISQTRFIQTRAYQLHSKSNEFLRLG